MNNTNGGQPDLTASPMLIGEWQFIPSLCQLQKGETEVKLEPQVARLLLVLANSDGEPQTRDDLIETAWPGTVVGDEVLTSAINKLRRALNDDSSQPNYIETLPKVGYRLVAKVKPLQPPAPKSQKVSLNKTGGFIVVGFALIAILLFAQSELMAPPSDIPGKTESINPSNSEIGFRDCDRCPLMVEIPPGSFSMGYEKGDPDEKPVRTVNIDYGFAVSTYEITFDEWDACLQDGGCGRHSPKDMGWGRGNQPVIFVSWLDAQTYARWLSDKTGKNYRLLTEAEWEYAAKGGSATLYPWGVTYDGSKANYGNLKKRTMPVGSYDANGFGLYDVVGNVWEWVTDCYDKNAYTTHQTYPNAFLETSETCRRVVRGGSWNVDLSDGYDLLRTSIRWRGKSNGRYNHFGFRVAREL